MSMFTQQGGGDRKPTAKKATAGGKPTQGVSARSESGAAKTAPRTGAKSTGKPAAKVGARPVGKPAGKGGMPRKPMSGMRVSQGRSWGPTALFAAVAAVAIAIIGYGGWQVYENGLSWSERASRIEGLENWRKKDPKVLQGGESNHQWGPVDYAKMPMNPPVGGTHNFNWQRCQGDVYDAPIATEHAIHSMEHGAVWITYKPDLAKDQVDKLAKRVKGNDFTLMSPYAAQDTPISLQTWGYQLKVSSADDKRIDEFLKALRQLSSAEPGATCSSGNMISETGTTPRDLGKDQPADPAGGGQPQPVQPGG